MQCGPHQSHAPRVASNTPTLQPGLASTLASKSTPAIEVPAGASNVSAAVVPAVACPDPTTLRTTSPSPACGRATSTTPPGHAVYAVAPGVGSHSDHDAFSGPKQAVTAYSPANEAEARPSEAAAASRRDTAMWSGERMDTNSRGAGDFAPVDS